MVIPASARVGESNADAAGDRLIGEEGVTMNNKNDPAFPVANDGKWLNSPEGKDWMPFFGLTKLEWFAGMALQGFFASPDNMILPPGQTVREFAQKQVAYFYDYAEAMLEESEKRRG
jgi:hypothetical protein